MRKILMLTLLILILMPVNAMAFENDENDITSFFELIKADAVGNADVPVITAPKSGTSFSNDENITIEFEYKDENDCYVQVSGIGSISVLQPVDNKVTIAKGKLVDGKSYSIRVTDGNVYSEVVEFTIDNDDKMKHYDDIKGMVNNVKTDISVDEMFPEGFFTTEDEASRYMTSVKVNVWQLKEVGAVAEENEETESDEEEVCEVVEYEKYPTTMYVTVNQALSKKVKGIFDELYELEFPVKYAGGYCWRETYGGSLSTHAVGAAIDINYEENYCIYSDGSVTGKLYEPGENPYSVTDEVVAVFEKYGFYWGGNWDSPKDYMHFTYYNT